MSKKFFFILLSIMAVVMILSACAKSTPTTAPVDKIVGDWTGTMYPAGGGAALGQLDISIQPGCIVDKICGSYAIPQIPCQGSFIYKGTNDEAFRFEQQLTQGELTICGTGSSNELTLLENGTISQTWTDGVNKTEAILTRK